MHKPKSVVEIGIHKILWYFEKQTDPLISTWKTGLVLINKKAIYRHIDFTISEEHEVKINQREKINKYLDLAKELKKKTLMVKIMSFVV